MLTRETVKSNLTFTLLRMLADGRFRSAEELASALGCSRASIEIRVRDLERLGVAVLEVRGSGYRLSEPVDLLKRDQLAERLACEPWPFRVEIVNECASTNALLLERTLQGTPHASVLAAEHQTAGRGRRGNAWLSAIGGSLAFSLLWRFEQGAAGLSGLSLAVAVGAARALESLGVHEVTVKWPNDILLGGRKLGGILIEMSADCLGPSAAVIGVGLNVRLTASMAERLPEAADLAIHGPPSRTLLFASLLEHLAGVLDEFSRNGFAPLREEWHARHAWQGREVALEVAERRVAEGRAVGVDDDGALLVRCANGVQRFHSGDLSLKPA